MRPIPVAMVILAFAAPLAAASAQGPEPMLGRGIELGSEAMGAPVTSAWSATTRSRFGVRLDYGGARGGGNGIRVSTMADNAFGVVREGSSRRVGQASEGAVTGTR